MDFAQKMDLVKKAHNSSIPELEKLVLELRDNYYNDDQLVSDEIYDQIEDLLRQKNPNSNVFKNIGDKKWIAKQKQHYFLGNAYLQPPLGPGGQIPKVFGCAQSGTFEMNLAAPGWCDTLRPAKYSIFFTNFFHFIFGEVL